MAITHTHAHTQFLIDLKHSGFNSARPPPPENCLFSVLKGSYFGACQYFLPGHTSADRSKMSQVAKLVKNPHLKSGVEKRKTSKTLSAC